MPRAGHNEREQRRTGRTFNSQRGLWMLSRLLIEHPGMQGTMTRYAWTFAKERPLVVADVSMSDPQLDPQLYGPTRSSRLISPAPRHSDVSRCLVLLEIIPRNITGLCTPYTVSAFS
jgi:hypothetical protein